MARVVQTLFSRSESRSGGGDGSGGAAGARSGSRSGSASIEQKRERWRRQEALVSAWWSADADHRYAKELVMLRFNECRRLEREMLATGMEPEEIGKMIKVSDQSATQLFTLASPNGA
jgi:hypothetical protein